MTFPTEIDGLSLTFDSRAKARGNTVPKKITVVAKFGGMAEVLSEAVALKVPPFAVVDEFGGVRVVSAGGSGAIWTLGSSVAQDEAVRILSAAMTEAFGIQAVKKAASKKKAARKVVPNTPVTDLIVESEGRVGWVSDALGSDPF